MGDCAVTAEKLSKQFRIGARREKYTTLRDVLAESVFAPFRRVGRLLRGEATGAAGLDETIWALRDVSFDIKQGETVGIIGGNGAGKSTLLKVLSRITEPTSGYADICGRVGSLLEVGTGFHPELTGQENIYLNGAILGMKRYDIRKKFDEIVAFSGVERFINTPVKHYSSGMYLRLAFAVAAHLEPEILIVDEVLAVGDAQFQKKCLNKMQDVGQEGRTVIFVSHNMPAVSRLCKRVLLLDDGVIRMDGEPHKIIAAYLGTGSGQAKTERLWPDRATAPGGEIARLRAVRAKTDDGRIPEFFDICRPILIEMEYEVLQSGYALLPHFCIDNEEGITVFITLDQDQEWRNKPRPAGVYRSMAWIPGNFLTEGRLFVEASLLALNPIKNQFNAPDAIVIRVQESFHDYSARGDWAGSLPGVVRPRLKWTTEFKTRGE